jgi:hypothetical protein
MDPRELKLQLAEVAGTWLAAIAVVVAGIFGVFQYLEHKEAVRIDRSMAFVERYHSDGLLMSARLNISESMTLHVESINQVLTDENIDPNKLATEYNRFIMQIVEEDSLAGPLEQIFTFYEQIILCREMNLCDKTVAEQFFDTDARAFIRTFYPYICAIRDKWKNPDKFDRVVAFYVAKSDAICRL